MVAWPRLGLKELQMRKPTRNVTMSFVSADDATVAVLMLHQLGLASTDIVSYTPGQMRARATLELSATYPSTVPGLEREPMATQRELARHGHSFVLVRAHSGPLLQRICRIAAEAHAHTVMPSASRSTPGAPARPSARPASSTPPTAHWQTASSPSLSP